MRLRAMQVAMTTAKGVVIFASLFGTCTSWAGSIGINFVENNGGGARTVLPTPWVRPNWLGRRVTNK